MARRTDWLWPFRNIASVTADADLLFGNLETTISAVGRPLGCGYCFRSDPNVISGLQFAGFDVMSVANNHIWDYGPDAFIDTVRYLEDGGIRASGGGHSMDQAHEPVFMTVGDARVAFLSYTNLLPSVAGAGPDKAGANIFSAEVMSRDVGAAVERADLVIVSFHAGEEYKPEPVDGKRTLYESIIDAGADMVIGHHPHVIQPMERYRDGWIAYSLGNFIFDQTFSEETMRGMMLEVSLKGSVITSVRSLDIDISRSYQASLAPQSQAQ